MNFCFLNQWSLRNYFSVWILYGSFISSILDFLSAFINNSFQFFTSISPTATSIPFLLSPWIYVQFSNGILSFPYFLYLYDLGTNFAHITKNSVFSSLLLFCSVTFTISATSVGISTGFYPHIKYIQNWIHYIYLLEQMLTLFSHTYNLLILVAAS